ncbi:copper ABC transporter permease [Sporosarcina sp. PTS2304]|uniref:ABC transporter permease subunit n=1 Tax=Sporosarcina sp. PTS2304 TaxID=2283194 RepID=UPI000E0DA90A|nr:ABC transporter permease subunit [Sporosarcina sp. PTS2304]AXH98280.1 copper ABC transporter permease [Sporosarcina sp. PTS2304]
MYIWKEFLEQTRGKGLWLGIIVLIIASLFLIAEARNFPADLGFEAMLLSVFDMNMYLLPLFSMFLASFSIFQEKELKTSMILLTKKESHWSFLFKKTIAIQVVLISLFIGSYLILAIFMKFFLEFHVTNFLHFLLVMAIFLLIFNQLGILLGTATTSKMQLVGANILVWFFIVFLYDLIFLYFLPIVSLANIRFFSWLYFLDPIHTMRFYLETSFGLFSLDQMSRMMEKFIFMDMNLFLLLNAIMWPVVFFLLTTVFRNGGTIND